MPRPKPIRTAFSGPTKKSSNNLLTVLVMIGVTALTILCVLLGLMYQSLSSSSTTTATTTTLTNNAPPIKHDESLELLQKFRSDFEKRYSPQVARDMLKAGVKSFGSIDHTAERMLRARQREQQKQNQNTFVMGFAGYSVTVGRGNYFHQSFPFVTGRLLKGLFQRILGTELVVRNAAIGGIPSFPYGFCLEHFLGKEVDVMSWDYGMNEGNGAAILESYIRLSRKQLSHQPMLVLLDKNNQRIKLLESYSQLGILQDSIALGKGEVVPKHILQQISEEGDTNDNLPEGFRDWNEFGAPARCPGRGSWHPKKMEHELIGWMLAMHLVECMERAIELDRANHRIPPLQPGFAFEKPLNAPPSGNPDAVTQLLYGHRADDNNNNMFVLKDLSCRTSFLPAVDHEKILPSVVVDGLIKPDMDIMEDRPDSMYQQGWVLDVSKVERDTKRKVEKCGGLGYIDMKVALYGVPDSGKLKLWLPYEGPKKQKQQPDAASHWFDDLILCEANEKRSGEACQLDRDLQITVGSARVSEKEVQMIDGAGAYLNRKTCLHVPIPSSAKVTRLGDVRKNDGSALSEEDKKRLSGGVDVGLEVVLEASSSVTRSNGACCVSHIVWENH